jgi:nucleotide-binding universal stress UspA family protein
MYQHILVGIDSGPTAQRALEVAVDLAKSQGATLEVTYAVDEALMRQARGVATDDMRASFNAALEQEGQSVLDHAVARARALGIEPKARLLVSASQHPAEQLAEAVKASGADLLVVGAATTSGLTRFLLGSVTDRLARDLPISMLIVRGGED